MNTSFPLIRNFSEIRDLIAPKPEFVIADRGWFSVVNYLVAMPDTFTGSTDEESAILRECRGLVFCNKTGEILSRPYHKFFNLNEREETQKHNIDWGKNFSVLDKLDGSMIRAIRIPGEKSDFRLATKMGITDIAMQAERFVARRPEYIKIIRECLLFGMTPIFEWCSNKSQVVISHPIDKLVLTGIRENYTGIYVEFNSDTKRLAKGIDLVESRSFNDIDAIVNHCKTLEDAEGYVIRFSDGHMLKVKGDWYLQLHKSKDRIRFEKDVIDLILDEKIDDIKPFLLQNDLKEIEIFEKSFNRGMLETASRLQNVVEGFKEKHPDASRRDFALAPLFEKSPDVFKPVFWKIYDGKSALDAIKDIVKKHIGSQTAVDRVRVLFGNVKFKGSENV